MNHECLMTIYCNLAKQAFSYTARWRFDLLSSYFGPQTLGWCYFSAPTHSLTKSRTDWSRQDSSETHCSVAVNCFDSRCDWFSAISSDPHTKSPTIHAMRWWKYFLHFPMSKVQQTYFRWQSKSLDSSWQTYKINIILWYDAYIDGILYTVGYMVAREICVITGMFWAVAMVFMVLLGCSVQWCSKKCK